MSVEARGVPHPLEGRDAVIEFLTHGGNYKPRSQGWTVHELVEEGDFVAARLTRKATRHDGGDYRNGYHFFFRFHDGQMVEIWSQLDTAHAFAELPPVGPDGLPLDAEASSDSSDSK
jgi:predicted SnoaL-like aldol condensation-catalyzing enzyme